MIFNSSYQTVDLEIEVTEEEYREWYIPRALRSFFCYSPAALGVPVLAFLDLPSLKLACFERGETAIWCMTMEKSTICFMFPMQLLQLISYAWWYVMHALTSKAWQVLLVDFQLIASTYRLSELEKKVLEGYDSISFASYFFACLLFI